jgi:DNA-directed RNA polymerase specialized sigma24 family protein
MRITVRSPLGVYHRIELPLDLPSEFQAGLVSRDLRRRERALEAFALHRGGYSYGEIAAALEIGKTTAFRHVREARQHCRDAAIKLGATLPEE